MATSKGSFFQKFQNKISVVGKDGSHARMDEPSAKTRPAFDDREKRDELRPWRVNPSAPAPASSVKFATGSAQKGDMGTKYGFKANAGMDRQSSGSDRSDGHAFKTDVQSRTTVVDRQDSCDLAYSKKARPVDYTPYTERDYKALMSDNYYELGKLGPDLDPEELAAKRQAQEKVKAYAESVRQENRQQIAFAPPPRKPSKPPSSRQKAMEFAKNVPKPKLKTLTSNSTDSIGNGDEQTDGSDEEETPLQQLQRRHEQDKALVEALKKQLRGGPPNA